MKLCIALCYNQQSFNSLSDDFMKHAFHKQASISIQDRLDFYEMNLKRDKRKNQIDEGFLNSSTNLLARRHA